MKWLTSLFMILFAGLLVASPGSYVKVLAVDADTPSGYSVDGVPITVLDTNKNQVASCLTTKEGCKFIAPWETKIFIMGGLDNRDFVAGDPHPAFVLNYDFSFCRTDNNECQKDDPTVILKAIARAQPAEPKPVEKSEYQNTVYVTIRAVDEKTESYMSNPGVLIYIVDANSGSVLGSGVTDQKGVSIAVPIDSKFRLYSKDSKDGRAYGYSDLVYYLQRSITKSTTGYMGCQSGAGCENGAEFYIKAHPSGSTTSAGTTTPTAPTVAPIVAKEYKEEESAIAGVYVITPSANTKISMVYSQTGASGGDQMASSNGDAKFQVKTGRIFYFIADGKYYSNKYVVKQDGQNYKLCDLSSGDYCTNDLTVKIYMNEYVAPTSVVKIPELIRPIPVPSEYGEYSLVLNKGWNLVSVPLTSAKVEKTSCDNAKVFVYDPLENKYRKVSLDSLYLETMQAFWVKAKDECKISFVGAPFKTDDIEGRLTLFPGWNMIGAARDSATWDELKGSCKAKSGPWSYNTLERKWERAGSLVPGEGYLVKVVDKCSLGTSSELPPLPPGDDVVIITAPQPTPAPTQPTPQPTSGYLIDKLVDDDAKIGSDSAPIVIVEFSDFQCPFCARFYSDTLPQLRREFIDTGKVQLVYRDYPLSFHENADEAALAAECADDQGKFEAMHNLLFDKQNSWSNGNPESRFKEYANSIGLDVEKFVSCYTSNAHGSEIKNDFNDGTSAGVAGTPTFYIGKRGSEAKVIVGAQAYSEFKKVIEELN